MNRRKFLAIACGGVVLAAGASIGTIANRFPHKAIEPWSKAGSDYSEPRMRALSYAILAPNPHNRNLHTRHYVSKLKHHIRKKRPSICFALANQKLKLIQMV